MISVGLDRKEYDATIVSDRTLKEIRNGRMTSSQVIQEKSTLIRMIFACVCGNRITTLGMVLSFMKQQTRSIATPLVESGSSGQTAKATSFLLQVGVIAESHGRDKPERLCRCVLRPAVSEKRLLLTAKEKIRYQLNEYGDFDSSSWVVPHQLVISNSVTPPKAWGLQMFFYA